ncbi:serine/threonine-protein kinase CHEK1 [Nematocida parisii]|uniref:non-specific serine/threonine protein kinase n=1 Tax=Nematocida parisii (strain ERTm3) TaxID=935791 RepID=I3EFZ5_NEMP3|nr:CAMK/CAMKL/CHK1 protein kinase [Nematocida parisii ERTm1]EIJ88142.1 CAMK/CAMKL/CHK1 protein kinase [Nematocida parisii ERTm3]KAI5130195.1 serine/threonine-protein kinase CHEK1 [Nematocida parisii]EIJ93792.1 CAMK/CAMKL/CHK1 protein kinase [Nematocida parisii ERTm1]KAI5130233.1 serine/threonine-protein kinase CHEK1 [Nematocida parisii]KAI5143825.1 serine/threonine-protein kinase CHEK1 [Nematocida parisii]|eukprot:XP_013059192.1 CAMK/CAMKL/CHK1 protein kinase [Nematocida parisii ERTm1]
MTAGLTEEKNEVPNIQIGEVIAHGATSTVRKGKSQSGAEYAIKIIFTETQNRKQEAKKEASIHKALAHKHIVKIQNFHQSKTHAYIIMDYAAKNELFMYIDPGTGLSEDICHLYLKQLFSVIKYIHSRGICHRDIKPENILLDSNYNLLLTDFGCSTIYRDANGRRPLTKHCGSSNYMAPDIHYGEYDGELVDVWSFGIVALVLLTGVVPWEKPVVEDKNFERFRISTFRDYSPFNLLGKNKLEMIEKCISVSQDKRIRLSRLGENPWLSAPNLYMDPDGMIRSPEIVAAKLVPADIAAFTQPDVCISPMGKECSSQPVFLSYDTFPIATRIYSCALVSVSLRILCKAFEDVLIPYKSIGTVISFSTVDSFKNLISGEVFLKKNGAETLIIFQRTRGDCIEYKKMFNAIKDRFMCNFDKYTNK